ncbi:MAG TPA: bifunctional biotin--[acetyl-CoA-carboxylase] ligase/biotin operon repressor BirA [Gammaproteobacteria bacterium]
MGKDAQILALLADGRFCSGQELAKQLGLSRSGVWKIIQNLQSRGIEVFAVQGKGYRLAQPIELLNKDFIDQHIAAHPSMAAWRGGFPGDVVVLWEIDSTNRYLLKHGALGSAAGMTCLAEMQSAGRGRRGRVWVSPLSGNIYLSQLWTFQSGPAQLSGLSLAAAIAVVRVIHQFGVSDAGLKWPNDILVSGKKIAGILLEMTGESNGPTNVIAGIGINVRLPDTALQAIDQPVTSLEAELGRPIERNRFVAQLICELFNVYERFSENGFSTFMDQWHDLDVYLNQRINLNLPAGTILGINRGVDQGGSLRVEYNGQIHCYQSGELSIRGQTS